MSSLPNISKSFLFLKINRSQIQKIQACYLYTRKYTSRDPMNKLPEPAKVDPIVASARKTFGRTIIPPELVELRFAYPEFLPNFDHEKRNSVLEKITRDDMIKRRTMIDIPEFYVGSILAVTITDHWAQGKISKFVGICIQRDGQGTFANFTLRNRVDGQGVEIRYDLYNPTIREIQVLRLEKRLDDDLRYLRDALPEYSEFPFDMAPEPPRKTGEPVRINTLQVEMKPWPWSKKWEGYELKGILRLTNLPDYNYINKWKVINDVKKFDLMAEYRKHISEDEQWSIWKNVNEHQKSISSKREIERRKMLIKQKF